MVKWRSEKDHLVSYQHVLEGKFSVQLSTNNTFCRIPVHQTVEETVSHRIQTPGGTCSFSLKPMPVSKYYLTAKHRSTCIRQLRALVELKSHGINHPNLVTFPIQKDESDVQSIIEVLESNWINPFEIPSDDLMSISSGIKASKNVVNDLITAQEQRENAYQEFVVSRVKKGTGIYNPLKEIQQVIWQF